MAQLACKVTNTRYSWTTTAYLTYSTSYDPDTNQTTITLESCNTTYWGTSGYGTSYTTNITASAVDNTASSGTSQCVVTSTTNGASKSFTGTPSPTTIVLQHSDATGDKQVKIDVSVSIYAAMSGSTQATATGTASETVTSGTKKDETIRIRIDGELVPAIPYIGKKKATAYRGKIKI